MKLISVEEEEEVALVCFWLLLLITDHYSIHSFNDSMSESIHQEIKREGNALRSMPLSIAARAIIRARVPFPSDPSPKIHCALCLQAKIPFLSVGRKL
jgi:hypothetical protein